MNKEYKELMEKILVEYEKDTALNKLSDILAEGDKSVKELIMQGLITDGEHHKQWYLEQIAKKLGIELVGKLNYEQGVSP
ncbi:MAG: hypothetical protein ACYCS1_05295 [Gammaproteobacteria bacterium]